MPPRTVAALFGGFMAVLALVAGLLPDGRLALGVVAGLSAAAMVGFGMRRNMPVDRAPWLLLAAALALSGIPVVDVGAYPALAAVLLIFVRRRTWRIRDRAALLDALAVTCGLALLAWTFLLEPRLGEGAAALAVPLGDLLCAGALARLLTVTGRRLQAGNLLVVGVAALVAADVSGAGAGRFVFCAAAGMAALHPSMTSLSVPAGAPPAEVSRVRLAVLGLASMVAPAVLLTAGDLTVAAVLSALTFLLVLVRMAGIMASHRQALARERGLREASAALVSAADLDGVGDATRAAVAQLMPADTPHAVVLALAIAEEGPPSADAAAQAALDRAAGTAARLVATREVAWAVGVRLAPFSTTLRCPMVLAERPAGDPLVGVLHAAAPAWALPGLQRAIEVLAGQAALAIERIGLSQEVIRRNSETYFRTLVQNTADVILIVGDGEWIRYASPSAVQVFGADPAGSRLPDVIHPGDRARLGEVLAAVRGGESLQEGQDFRAVGGHRSEALLEMHCRDLRAEPTVAGLVITLRDVTERRRLERELTHQAFHDSMTGLANRVLFQDRLRHALARAARDGSVVGVLFIDLDDFKIVNDTHGHAAGDELLITVADRIAGALRADDTAARLGGDEFAALVENVQDPGAVEETAQRILAALADPVVVDEGLQLNAVASIGITTTPEADTADELLRQADLALYVAKGAGKNQWRRYQAHLHSAMVARLELRSALDHAVHEGHFLLAYQPIVDLMNDEPVGFEALVRWFHPTKGVVSPAEFIEVAEESGLVVPMGRWVLQQALHTVAQWRRILPRSRRPYVSVNVSARQFRESGFVEEILKALAYAEVPPGALMLELTRVDDAIWPDLAALREHGVRIAVDGLGADPRHRPVDVVKIDRMADPAVVGLARSLGLTLIAEGIETAADRDLFAGLGCALGQGYFYSSPVDGTEALSQMTNRQPLVA
jgi:diguanylate cyclase (GGDEF)-like protein/PAS domain S-box-containing protein